VSGTFSARASDLQRRQRRRGDAVLDLRQHPDRKARLFGQFLDRDPLVLPQGAHLPADRGLEVALPIGDDPVGVLPRPDLAFRP
jgi:hypothetical protein